MGQEITFLSKEERERLQVKGNQILDILQSESEHLQAVLLGTMVEAFEEATGYDLRSMETIRRE